MTCLLNLRKTPHWPDPYSKMSDGESIDQGRGEDGLVGSLLVRYEDAEDCGSVKADRRLVDFGKTKKATKQLFTPQVKKKWEQFQSTGHE